MATAVATSLIGSFVACAAASAEPQIQQIRINSTFNADNLLDQGPPPLGIETIDLDGQSYVSSGRPVDRMLVDNLIHALQSPQVEGPSLADWGVTQEWLKNHVVHAFAITYQRQARTALPAQRKLFFRTFQSLPFAQKALPHLSAWSYTSDSRPSVRIVVTMTDGDHVWAEADSQSPFMVPWTIERAGRKFKTWNVAISRAVAAIVPRAFLNADWLRGDTLLPRMADEVETSISARWSTIGAEAKAPRLFAKLRSDYAIDKAEVSTSYNEDFISSSEFQKRPRPYLWATLSRQGDPPNFKIYFVASDDGRNSIAPLPGMVDHYAERVLSIPWLARIIATRPKWQIGIRIYDGRSFNKPGLAQFIKDMQGAGRPDLGQDVTKAGDDVVLLISDRGRWLVLPDNTAILWRAVDFDLQGWLGFSPTQFEEHDCDSLTNNCPAVAIAPGGKILPAPLESRVAN